MSSPSISNSSASLSLIYLANSIAKSAEWLNDLRELHYIPYNSCNSLTIYSYKYWLSQNRFLVATKANSLKEFYFKSVLLNDDTNSDDYASSNRSSVSSNTSGGLIAQADNKIDSKSMHSELTYLEPFVRTHQFSKIKSNFICIVFLT